MKTNTVSISKGNIKMGAIPSVSLPPVVTCASGAPCVKKCYACKMCRIYKNVKESYNRNLSILESDPTTYWLQVSMAMTAARYFRFHVSGDIPNAEYFANMVHLANFHPHCEILCFTKQYGIVNNWLAENGGELPNNLHLIFSLWDEDWNASVENPYNLPMSAVIFKDGSGANYDKVCGGNCFECACKGEGCWELKGGETIAFHEH